MDIVDMIAEPTALFVGHHRAYPPYGHRMDGAPNWLIAYTIRGRGLFRQPGVELEVGPGDLVCLRRGAISDYSTISASGWEYSWAHFTPRPGWSALSGLPEVGDGLLYVQFADRQMRTAIRRTFDRLLADGGAQPVAPTWHGSARIAFTPPGLQAELVLNALEEIVLRAAAQTRAADSSGDGRVRRVLEVMANTPHQSHTLRSLADAVHVSPSRLSHMFKQHTGLTPMQALATARMRHAATLLLFTDNSVGDVARQAGFSSIYYFSRQFSRHQGVSPSEFRRRARTDIA